MTDTITAMGNDLKNYAYNIMKEHLINCTYAPGSILNEAHLTAGLKLSRTPVREALIELSKVKIVEIYPQKGSAVALIDYDLVEESRFMRKVLECAVVELDCEMATPEDIRRLQENVRLQNFYLENYYPEALMDLDNQFHALIFEIAHKDQVYALMDNISIHFDRVRSMALSAVKNLKIVQDHENLVNAIARKDAAAATSLMELHLSRYKIDAKAIREKYPDYFR